ncbi:hypothetical protein Clacol_007118 [Clathrus columnatus]|uniref:F-box domain-containing protein n=1 Tax=Clathrus columnatus TaxID=1419009 RepID=A0AAV5AE17_9AGAM|nr:hypothetical protein Clacol_007118 [Clathrus columnatus]
MSTQWITRFPAEVLFLTIGAINDRNDLLSLALTCRFISQLIIPDKIKYFRISSLIENPNLWDQLLKNLYLCKGTHEFELTDGIHVIPLERWFRNLNNPIYTTIVYDSLPKIIRNMVNLSRVKFSWRNTNLETLWKFLDALGDSGCRLEEFDLFLDISHSMLVVGSELWMKKLEEPRIWTKFDRTALQKLSIRTTISLGGTGYWPIPVNWVGNILSDTPRLTHLSLSIQHITPSANLFDYTWPNLENLIINNGSIFSRPAQPQSKPKFSDFFKRHPTLTTLSLPYNIYRFSNFPDITVECLPNLASFAYDGLPRFPSSLVLSPVSARRLRHLTICDNAAALQSRDNMNIYKELTSLQTLCFTVNAHGSNYKNIDEILEILAVHATGLQKIHLPTDETPLTSYYTTLSILQRFPKLTHLSGIWAYNIDDRDPLLQELYQCRQLEYAIHVGHDNTPHVFRLVREFEHEDKCMLVEVDAERNPNCDMRTWGGFYKKI